MRGRTFGATVAVLAMLPSPALAARVLVLGHHGHVSVRQNRFLSAQALTPAPAPTTHGGLVRAPPRRVAYGIGRGLTRLRQQGSITWAQYSEYRGELRAALQAVRGLSGTPAAELGAVIDNLRQMTGEGFLTPSRLPVLFLTLERNREWWSAGVVPQTWQRIQFAGSKLIWQYYPGQGIQLQVLGTFGEADGLYTAGPTHYPQFLSLLGEMIPLAVQRAGGLAWEYYFHFDGGNPPWVSAMSQGTALEALTRAFQASPDPVSTSPYLKLAHRALSIFTAPPPGGVRLFEPSGLRFLQYSFAPGTDIINAFLQSLVGLYDYAQASGDPTAAHLFAAGDAEAQAELPSFDTGAWSLYQPGAEDPLSYHLLVTGFLKQLCARTAAPVYCREMRRFRSYLKTPPALELRTTRLRAGVPGAISFGLSKYSHVGIVVSCHGQQLLATSADFAYGANTFALPALPAGVCDVRLAATDLAGNFNGIQGTVTVRRRRRH